MAPRLRRRLLFCLCLLALTIPAETILLQALTTNDSDTVRAWVASLSPQALDDAAGHVQSYPFAYRKAIMAAVSPARRADVWRGHMMAYLSAHPEVPADATPVIGALIALATPEVFGQATPDVRHQTSLLAEQLKSIIGNDETEYLLFRLGPKDGTFASRAPLSHRLAQRVRGWMTALANNEACNCSADLGCSGETCVTGGGCDVDNDWPMCGWWWNDPCDGQCRASNS